MPDAKPRARAERQQRLVSERDARLEFRRQLLYAKPCTYIAAHQRVRSARGSASRWHCVVCGAVADEWSLRPGSSREQSGPAKKDGKLIERRWSPDPADYEPLCQPCHGERDNPQYGRGYRNDPARVQQREWVRESYARTVATPEGRAAYRARKLAELHRRRAAASAGSEPAQQAQ